MAHQNDGRILYMRHHFFKYIHLNPKQSPYIYVGMLNPGQDGGCWWILATDIVNLDHSLRYGYPVSRKMFQFYVSNWINPRHQILEGIKNFKPPPTLPTFFPSRAPGQYHANHGRCHLWRRTRYRSGGHEARHGRRREGILNGSMVWK